MADINSNKRKLSDYKDYHEKSRKKTFSLIDFFKTIPNNCKIVKEDYYKYFKIKNCKIETDNGIKDAFWFQLKMVNEIVNNRKTFLSNQSNALYGNYCFRKNRKINRFVYNMLLLEDSSIYLYNVSTKKFRRIYYDLEVSNN